MRLVVRCDASRVGGAGHFVRGLSLAQSALALGHEVTLAGSIIDVTWLADAVALEQLTVVDPPPWGQFSAWAASGGFDAVHVDSYDAPTTLLTDADRAGIVLSNVEDGAWGRRPAHVVSNPSLGATAADTVLGGPAYVLLRTAVRRGRLDAAARMTAERPGPMRVLVVLGGTDASDALPSVLSAVARASEASRVPLRVTAVTTGDWRILPEAGTFAVELLPPTANVVKRMAAADLIVTAAGTTIWEAACLGVPVAALPVVDNQLAGYRELVGAGLAFGLGNQDAPGLSAGATKTLAFALSDGDARRQTADRAARLVDGSGAARVMRAIELAKGAPPPPAPPMIARPATAADLWPQFAWRNDPLVRGASQNKRPVNEEEHRAWFTNALGSQDRRLLVVQDEALQAVGSVRWDALTADRSAWEVSIMLAPHHRGRGWGGAVLATAEQQLRVDEPRAVFVRALASRTNAASRSMFLEAGYTVEEESEGEFLALIKSLRAFPS